MAADIRGIIIGGRKKRVVSGAVMEEGREKRHLRGGAGGTSSYDSLEKEEIYEVQDPKKSKKRLCTEDTPSRGSLSILSANQSLGLYIGIGVIIALIVIISVAVVVSRKNSDGNDGKTTLPDTSPGSIPAGAPAWLNPSQWADTVDFNVTYTDATVGDLPVMGLYSAWDDSTAANPNVPALDQDWGDYAKRPARG